MLNKHISINLNCINYKEKKKKIGTLILNPIDICCITGTDMHTLNHISEQKVDYINDCLFRKLCIPQIQI